MAAHAALVEAKHIMSELLTTELKREHEIIRKHLQQASVQGISGKEGQSSLAKAKSALLAHLAKEDAQLYPVLRQAALKDQELAFKLQLYARDMEQVSAAALAFFEKYAKGGSGLAFAQDFGALNARLKLRIDNEEAHIYSAFDRLQARLP